jgi:aspartate kinase
MITVEKIGGTSMSQFDNVLKNIIIGKRNNDALYNRIFVVSAYNNVTNWLLEDKQTKEPGIFSKFVEQTFYRTFIDKLLINLKEINRSFANIGLNVMEADVFISNRIKQAVDYLEKLNDVLTTGYVSKNDIFMAAREILASVGEAHSAFNSVNILLNNGINAVFVDLSGFTDSEFLTIDERIKKALLNVDFTKELPIVTGYTKGVEGIMRVFDRGYSEVTFSKVAIAVKADEAIIHKESHLLSADYKIVGLENAVLIGATNYDVADQLADIGMQAIHPKTSKPLELAGISLRIKNSFEPDNEGTIITKNYISPTPKVEIVTGTNKVIVIEIQETMMIGEIGFDLEIMKIFYNHKVSYIVKSTAANSISVVIWEKDFSQNLLNDLKTKAEKIVYKECALVCIIGSNLSKPGILADAAKVLSDKNINIDIVSFSLKQVNIQLVVSREKYFEAINLLNSVYFSN